MNRHLKHVNPSFYRASGSVSKPTLYETLDCHTCAEDDDIQHADNNEEEGQQI